MLILASQSPRRQALLRAAGADFRIVVPGIVEEDHHFGHPADMAARTASAKIDAVAPLLAAYPNDTLILAADTIVALGDTIFNKPADGNEARAMLRALSGKTHTVHSGIAIERIGRERLIDSIPAQVTFNPLDDQLIEDYVASGEPLDKAGGYGIQGLGAKLVAGVDGDITSVIGLPMRRLAEMFEQLTGEKLYARPLKDLAIEAFGDLKLLSPRCLWGLND